MGTPKSILESRVIKWSKLHHHDFKIYVSPSGEITKKTKQLKSQSFLNYYDALQYLNLANEQTGFVVPSRLGLILKDIHKVVDINKVKNAYELTSIEKVFYLYVILKYDTDYFLNIYNMVYSTQYNNLTDYIKNFQDNYIKRLNEKLNHSLSGVEQNQITDALLRVKEWRSVGKYSEDIVPPRINWLIDLGLIENDIYSEYKKIKLNQNGLTIQNEIYKNDSNILDINDIWLNTNFAKFSSLVIRQNNTTVWNNLKEKEKENCIKESFFYCLKFFRILRLPRLSVEQTLLFTTLYLLFKKRLIVEMDEISNWIGFERVIGNKIFGLRKAARSYESYIAITNE